MTSLRLPVRNGTVIFWDVTYSDKITGTILSVGCLCTLGVVPVFNDLGLLLLVSGFLVTTTFNNNCLWLDVLSVEGTKRLAAVTPSNALSSFEMNPISRPATTSFPSREWHKQLGHVCDKMVLSFLKQHLPLFDCKSWQPFYCEICATSKSTHRLVKACIVIPKENPLHPLVSDVMGRFATNPQGFCYLITVRDHASAYSMVYPLKSHSDTPKAILDVIKQFQVQLQSTPKALQTDNSRDFMSSSFTLSLAKLGVSFFPSLPYSPQENGESK
ncbi:hypothetical protein O181_038684 [Austropuccinia psidii MF-1]|uniref:Integrase catalytic domain-containing protein n=1 Tax=Austropuccinia psidii MF-1 TaxID=1389203 RepID=A0A9Q3HDT4_9BASI|nr:hypothetical protein [Austropuccinia psidii MF-1]